MDTMIDTLTMNGQTLFDSSDKDDISLFDPVDSPPHYTHGKIECIEAIREIVRRIDDGEEGYYAGNVMKYLWRYNDKGGLESLEKGYKYYGWLIQRYKEIHK